MIPQRLTNLTIAALPTAATALATPPLRANPATEIAVQMSLPLTKAFTNSEIVLFATPVHATFLYNSNLFLPPLTQSSITSLTK